MSIHANINLLVWESDFFGRHFGHVVFDDAAPILTIGRLTNFALVQAKVAVQETTQIDELSALGFRLVESEVDCCYTCPDSSVITHAAALPAVEIRMAKPTDIPALRALVAQTLVLSRFRSPWFSNEERQSFYSQWVENSVYGSFDHFCLVAEGSTSLEGLVTLRDINEQTSRIGLLAVSPVTRGRGIGKLLCHSALNWYRSRGFKQLLVATQVTNLPALRLYLASGAQIVSAAYWLYRGSHDSI